MFEKNGSRSYRQVTDRIQMKTLVWGEKTLMAEFRLEKGAEIPPHRHPHEQTGYLVSGRLVFETEGERWEAFPGDGWCFPPEVEHRAAAVEDSVAVEVFSPVREEYKPED